MFGMFSPDPPRRVTYNRDGLVNDELAPQTFLHNGTNIRKVGVDGVIMISTDAASKITERAIGLAFDNWAETIVKDYKEAEAKKSDAEDVKKPKSKPKTNRSQNAISKKKSSTTATSLQKPAKSPPTTKQ